MQIVFYREKSLKNTFPPVSVVICAKNEEENLKKNLPLFLKQNYPDFEVIVVDDASEDNTQNVLKELSGKYPHLKHTKIFNDNKFRHNKKLALTIGIKAAKHDQLVLSDADCVPSSQNWILKMVSRFSEKTEVVLAYGGFHKKKGLLNKIIRFDAAFIALQYLSFALAKIPYMGVGRNLAYKKQTFLKKSNFHKHIYLDSGDDDLFINKISKAKNTKISFHEESITRSETKKTWKEWIIQKSRHVTTGKLYRFRDKLLLFFEPTSRILFYSLFFYLVYSPQFIIFIVLLFGIRFLLQIFVFSFFFKRAKELDLLYIFIFLDILLPIFYLFLFFRNLRKHHYRYERYRIRRP